MSTARLLLMYLTYIVSCGRTYYTSQTLTRPVVIVMYCLASIWLLANLGPLQRMLPERGAGLGLGSNYGLRCPLARAGDPYGEAPAQADLIFYRRLMPASVDPTTFKNSYFGRASKKITSSAAQRQCLNPAVQRGSGLSCTRRCTGGKR